MCSRGFGPLKLGQSDPVPLTCTATSRVRFQRVNEVNNVKFSVLKRARSILAPMKRSKAISEHYEVPYHTLTRFSIQYGCQAEENVRKLSSFQVCTGMLDYPTPSTVAPLSTSLLVK